MVGTMWLWGAPLLLREAAEETLSGRKGVKGLLLVGHKKVPHGSGLTGDWATTQQVVLESRGCLNHGLLLLFLRHGTPDWAKGRRKGCVRLWVF